MVVAAGAVMIGLSGRVHSLAVAGSVVIGLAVAAAAVDWIRLTRGIELEVMRECDDRLSLGARNPVRLRLRNSSYTRLSGRIRDEHPVGIAADGQESPFSAAARSETEVVYHLVPTNRGDFEFGDIYIRLFGPLRMTMRQIRFAAGRQVKVYPNLLDVRRYEAGLRRQRPIQPGRRATRVYGRGTDFESLRDYLPDDELRSVDWKATARRGRLTTRQYQQERSQNVLVALDCGRTMGPVIDGLTRLDHAVNAAMMLAHVAAVRGDRVGLFAFGEDVRVFAPPKQGRSQTIRMLSLAYNLRDASGDSDYARAFGYLSRKWTRRSLLVVFADLVDPESSRPLVSQISGLARKHLCVVAAISDPSIVACAYGEPSTVEDAFRAAAARQVLEARQLVSAQLAGAGAIVLDITPAEFTPSVVERYLDIKSRALL